MRIKYVVWEEKNKKKKTIYETESKKLAYEFKAKSNKYHIDKLSFVGIW